VSPSIRRRSLYFIQVVVPPADLIVTGVGTAATTVQAGQTVSVSNSIKNQGGTQTGPFTVAFYLSTNGTVGDGDDTVSTTSRTVSTLKPGASTPAKTAVLIPPGTAAGVYYLCAKADADDGVTESSKTNNGGCTTTTLTVFP